MRRFLWVLAVLPTFAAAERFTLMSGPEIEDLLSGRDVIYEDGATQDFRPSGATLYNAGRDSWGYWAVRGDQYCSRWPPSDGWACYDVAHQGRGVVKFIAEDGSFSIGTFTD